MGKVALVTGGSSGIGAMIAEELHKAGFKTVAAARRLEKMASLQALGVTAVQLDVTDEASTDRGLAEIRSSVGEIDILVNCAGVAPMGPAEMVPEEIGRHVLEVNYFALISLTRKCLPYMRKQRWGRVINISSPAGVFTQPFNSWYNGSKHAVEGFTKSLRQEMAQFGVVSSVVRPGAIKSELMDSVLNESAAGLYDEYDASYGRYVDVQRQIFSRSSGGEADSRKVALAVVKAATSRNPRLSYNAPLSAAATVFVCRFLLPENVSNRLFARYMGCKPSVLNHAAETADSDRCS